MKQRIVATAEHRKRLVHREDVVVSTGAAQEGEVYEAPTSGYNIKSVNPHEILAADEAQVVSTSTQVMELHEHQVYDGQEHYMPSNVQHHIGAVTTYGAPVTYAAPVMHHQYGESAAVTYSAPMGHQYATEVHAYQGEANYGPVTMAQVPMTYGAAPMTVAHSHEVQFMPAAPHQEIQYMAAEPVSTLTHPDGQIANAYASRVSSTSENVVMCNRLTCQRA